MKVSNIKLGFSKSRYSHNLSRDTNTTFPFGVVQPIFSQYMLPNSDINVQAKQLVRLAPMPVPSFARVSLRTVTRFIPEIDVVPYADAFYSKLPYRGKVPTTLPFINNPVLVYYLLSISNYAIYSIDVNSNYTNLDDVPSALKYAFAKMFFSKPFNVQFPFKNDLLLTSSSASALRPLPTPDNADYVVYLNSKGDNTSPTHCLCFNFGFRAKIFRNICIGLGYSLDMDDFTPVRFSPLLSFYRAYYDTYGLTRFMSFTETGCFDIITNDIDTLHQVDFTLPPATGAFNAHLQRFFDELSNCYYSTSQDFVSVHRDTLAPGTSAFEYSFNSDNGVETIQSTSNNIPSYDVINNSSGTITNITLQALTRLSRFVNKNSVLGKRLTDYMRLHYGSDVVASIFKDSNFVDSSVLDCQINDVFSTSDTAQYDSSTDTRTGENLGAFAGKGIGFGDLSFRYSSPCHGYIITLAAVVPDSGYFQGTSTDLFAVDWEQQPSADFDALGMEATPRSAFISHNDISNRFNLSQYDLTNTSFGFVPRFSGFKFAKNVVNGDMSRRGSIDSLSPYYLDHIISSHQIDDISTSTNKRYQIHSAAVPSSSYDWRYVCKYPWLGNFLRLFINDVGDLSKGSSLPVGSNTTNPFNYYCLDDPFICQCAFRVTVSNCLKPLSLSFDTYEESTDNSSKDVDPS